MRQGGADFLKHCKLSPPPGDLQAGLPGRNLAVATLESSISVAGHEVRPLAELLQPPPPIPEVSTDEVDEVEPEVLILGLRPQSGLASPLLLQATLEALSHKFQQEDPGAFSSLELLGVRLVDLDTLSSMSGADSALRTTTSMALQGFRSFAQVARHALDEASNYWWSSASGGEAIEHGVVSLICLRGENAIRRFKNFLVREWTLTAATSGEVLFSPTRAVARQCYRAFFQLEEPTFQQAFALITPPDLNATLYRALTVFEQQGFQLLGAFALGPLPHPWAEALYAQDRDEDFRCIFLVLSRQQAVKKVAQLCGAADPEVNHKLLRASLRHGRDRIHNGIRCATSLRSAEKLLRLLEPTVAPRVCLRRLGLDAEAAQQGLQCALLVAVSAQLSHLQLLRDCLHSLQAAHHTVVGLRFSAGWPTSATSDVKVPWRNPMEKVSELIDAGTWPIFLALEGRYVLSAADALSGLKAQGVAFYVASNAQQGAADVAEVFGSYDTQQDLREFEAALRYLASQHNRSAWSPNGMSALMLGEFGLPQSKMTLPDITYILGNVINSALAMGVSYILFWETFCNECLPGPGCGADGRCREKVPVTEVDRLNGFWLVWPDGTKAWPWRYLHQKLHEAPESELWALRREREDETGALYGRSTLALLGSAAVAVASIFRYCRVHRRIQFVEAKDVHLRINIFHCCFYDAEADQPMLPREETELKRNIFEVPRRLKHQQAIEDALGVTTLEFGGDCAAGLCHEKQPPGPSELSIEDNWRREDLYSPGSFFCENLGHWGPKTATLSQLRFRQWEVCRGEVLRIPERQVMTLRQGQHLWIQSRGPGNDEPAGRLEMSEGSSLRCLGGTVENEGVLARGPRASRLMLFGPILFGQDVHHCSAFTAWSTALQA
eukprot:g4971.t1